MILDDTYKLVVNSPDAVKTVELLIEFVKVGPTGMTACGYGDMVNSLVQRDDAFYLDASKICKTVEYETKSRVKGKVGYALHPTINGNCGSGTGGFAMGIPANSKNTEAAFLFIPWMTKKSTNMKLAEMGGDPIQASTMNDAGLQVIPSDVIEASKIGGATWLKQTLLVKLPMIKSVPIVALLMRIVDVYKVVEVVFILTEGGPRLEAELLELHV